MSIAPVAATDRIQSLDVMRGLAVLGILAVNAQYFAAPWQTGLNPTLTPLGVSETTLWSWLAMHVFFEFKFITLFSILFGASLYMVGGERDDSERGAVLRRRLGWLLIFGLIHATLIWSGDILVTYAITGFMLIFVRSWPARTLLTTGATLYLLSLAWQWYGGLQIQSASPGTLDEIRSAVWAPPAEAMARAIAAMQSGWLSATQENIAVWLEFLRMSMPSLIPRTAGVMMIGMALFKNGFLAGKAPAWAYALMAAAGAAAIALIGAQAWFNTRGGFEFPHMVTGGILTNTALSILCSLGYAALMVLLVKAKVGAITAPLAAVGRMAFSNYLAQSVIMTTIFWGGRGFGLFGEVDRPSLWLFVLAIWALQLIWSPLWLSRFQMGPAEWLWRRLSYARPLAMEKVQSGGSA